MSGKFYPSVDSPNVVGRFRKDKRLDVRASREADEVRYREVIILEAKITGSPDWTPVTVKPDNQTELSRRFPQAWADFQGELVQVEGTPLQELGLDEDKIAFLQLNGVFVAEQVASLSDAQCQNFGFGFRKLREKALALTAPEPPPKRRGRPPAVHPEENAAA